jgi:UDP-glucose 4-epimerase
MGSGLNEERISKMSILITGCAGFIGSHLCERLLNDGYSVIGIDNLSFGTTKNIHQFFNNDRFSFYHIDLLDDKLDEVFKNNDIKTIFHLAGNSMIREESSRMDIRNTLNSTLAVLEMCHKHGVKEFIFASSGSVYGDATEVLEENYGALMPISHYAAAKLSSEAFISSYSWMYGMKAWICRFPNVTGEHATHGVVLGFVSQIKNNPKELKVLGNGTQTKAYMYVKDCIDAVVFVWKNAKERLNYFNISGGGETSVKEIAEAVVKKMGTDTKIIYQESNRGWVGDVPLYKCDISKLLSLGWKPLRTSNEAIELSINNIYEDICGY